MSRGVASWGRTPQVHRVDRILTPHRVDQILATHRVDRILATHRVDRILATHRVDDHGFEVEVPLTAVRHGDRIRVTAGEVVPADGTVVSGAAMIDESALTGVSEPVMRAAPGAAVIAGTVVLSGGIGVRVTSHRGHTVLERTLALVTGARRPRTRTQRARSALLVALTLLALVTLTAAGTVAERAGTPIPPVACTALVVGLAPATIGAVLAAAGCAGRTRLFRARPRGGSARAMDAAGGIDVLVLDTTDAARGRAAAVPTHCGITGAHLARLRRLGVRTVLLTADEPGDEPAEHSLPVTGLDVVHGATDGDALHRVRAEQDAGHQVAFIGQHTADAPALAQADLGIARHAATSAARSAGALLDPDTDPSRFGDKLVALLDAGQRMRAVRDLLLAAALVVDAAGHAMVVTMLAGGAFPAPWWATWWGLWSATGPGAALAGTDPAQAAIWLLVTVKALATTVLVVLTRVLLPRAGGRHTPGAPPGTV